MSMHLQYVVALYLLLLSISALALDSADDFDGSYGVGPTTCTVSPIKMAFEVRWAHGTGPQIFFYDSASPFGSFRFVSERKPDGFDHFVFYDSGLKRGVFIRADGIRFPVRKQQRRNGQRGQYDSR